MTNVCIYIYITGKHHINQRINGISEKIPQEIGGGQALRHMDLLVASLYI
jgi:hypothetical protein